MNIRFHHLIVIKYLETNQFYKLNFLVFPIAEKPNTVKPNRPFTTQEVVSKLSNRQNKINVDPIGKGFNHNLNVFTVILKI